MRKKFKYLLIFLFILIPVVLGVTFFMFPKQQDVGITALSQKIAQIALPVSPTPFPFIELTIPYLRERKYQSSLGELEETGRNNAFTSYLTSYNSDGLKVNGQMTVPIGQRPTTGWPTVIFLHGYIPPAQYQTLVNYSSYVDYLAQNGLVVFKIDLRGHGNSEGEASGAYYSGDYIVDTLNAYAALQTADFVNPNKIGIWGHSMTGNVVLRTLAAKPEIPAAVIWAGAVYTYSDMQKYGINDGSYQPPGQNTERQRKRQKLRDLYGEFDPDNFFWQQVSPVNYLNDFTGTLQINHALDDNVVDIGYSRDLDLLLTNAKVPHELREYPSGGHNFTGSAFNQAMKNTAEFFRQNL